MADPHPGATQKLALLIDADNVRADFLPIIIREASTIGRVVIRRVYGHFASSAMTQWQPLLHSHALTPVHVPPAAVGKNATDMKLAIEAMDMLHEKGLDGFCIASSDSDFTTLASRIREDGLAVYGFGEQKSTKPYVAACDRFFYCDLLLAEERQEGNGASNKATKATPQTAPRLPRDDIFAAIEDVSGDDGWAHLGQVGQILSKRMPDFDPRNYGFRKLVDLMDTMAGVEVRRVDLEAGGRAVMIRLKVK
ncbi:MULTISPECIES: NYN domain-containing protein [Kaistia]|uniref:NYN domain-containing protein n=1 Tax=Kaistia nematophila TaxID=2994654 RepID=A0A9X3EDE0_9HYPH|nr:NYN domain-containing protein [Kaistia nematophila]MBN9024174.1 NYN domain-containing protein [Hyphomicrobiales bacterium]MCX5570895.1 NYN domain-containing protein [Kaistia nematophila]